MKDTRDAPPRLPRGVLLDRRRFLKASLGATGAYAVAAGGATWLVAPDKAWAVTYDAFDPDLARTLLAMTRALYPHEFLGDVHYALVVKDLDVEAAGGFDDTAFIDMMRDGALALDEAAGGDFAAQSEEDREAVLRTISESHPDFFQAVRGKQVVSLYNQPEVWGQFGYEGPSHEIGGYLHNGFQDISWLPDPPAEASTPVTEIEDTFDTIGDDYMGPVGSVPVVDAAAEGN